MEYNQDVVTATTENAGAETIAVPSEEDKVKATEVEPKVEEKPKEVEKTFTQAEVDKILESRLARHDKKDINVDLQKELDAVKKELSDYKQELSLKNANVGDEYKDFVKFQVSKMATNEKSFEDALKEYMAGEGKKFEKQSKTEAPKITMTRPENIGAEDEISSLEERMRKAMKL